MDVQIIKTKTEMNAIGHSLRDRGETIGFVPTMGALHQGHIELVKQALAENTKVVCSIFVNPIQFNNPDDLKKYPRTFEQDIEMLSQAGCDYVFYPEVEEMYPETVNMQYDFGLLDKVMEGKYRQGHFNGVAIVVSKLFEIVLPHKSYFGQKDYQQLAIIRALVKKEGIPVEIVSCPTVREADGLAMSSRNRRLTKEERAQAHLIYRMLQKTKELYPDNSAKDIKDYVCEQINDNPYMQIEYFEISDAETLEPVFDSSRPGKAVACIAVFMGQVRLIDNILFN